MPEVDESRVIEEFDVVHYVVEENHVGFHGKDDLAQPALVIASVGPWDPVGEHLEARVLKF